MMTRSAEIPEAAVVAAANAALDAGFIDPDDGAVPQWLNDGKPPVWTHPSEAVKVILAAALPYLVPAVPTKAELAGWLRDIFSNDADPEGTTWEVAAEELQALLALHATDPQTARQAAEAVR